MVGRWTNIKFTTNFGDLLYEELSKIISKLVIILVIRKGQSLCLKKKTLSCLKQFTRITGVFTYEFGVNFPFSFIHQKVVVVFSIL